MFPILFEFPDWVPGLGGQPVTSFGLMMLLAFLSAGLVHRAETKRIVDLMKPGGGYIASASHDYLLPETPIENVLAMFDAIREYGTYDS